MGKYGYFSPWSLARSAATNMFYEASTFGTILVLVVYALANLSLPFYYRKHVREKFNAFRHGVLPVVGTLLILVPLYYLTKPGQLTSYDWYPYAALATVVLAIIYSMIFGEARPEYC